MNIFSFVWLVDEEYTGSTRTAWYEDALAFLLFFSGRHLSVMMISIPLGGGFMIWRISGI